jgi:transcriptional regulator with XRE-family HTH domain
MLEIDKDALRRARAEAHLSQIELARAARVGISTIGALETGRQTHARDVTVARIARALGCTPASLAAGAAPLPRADASPRPAAHARLHGRLPGGDIGPRTDAAVPSVRQMVAIDQDKLRRARLDAHLSQQALAVAAHVNYSTVWALETGRQTRARHVTVLRIALALGRSAASLAPDPPDPPSR